MRLVTYRANVEAEGRLGAIVSGNGGEYVLDLELFGEEMGVPFPATMLEFIDLGPQAVAIATALISRWAPRSPSPTSRCSRRSRARARTSSASASTTPSTSPRAPSRSTPLPNCRASR